VNEGGTISVGVDLFEVNDEFGRIMLGICEDFGAEEGDDMVRNDLNGLVAEVRVVDTKVCVKPLDLIRYEFAGNEALEEEAWERDQIISVKTGARHSPLRQRFLVLWHVALLCL
jgi:hypothetical protein